MNSILVNLHETNEDIVKGVSGEAWIVDPIPIGILYNIRDRCLSRFMRPASITVQAIPVIINSYENNRPLPRVSF